MFMQMVHEETHAKDHSDGGESEVVSEDFANEQIPAYEDCVEDGDDEESETSATEDGGDEEIAFDFDSFKSDESLLDNGDESEWEVSDFLSSDESDNDWEP